MIQLPWVGNKPFILRTPTKNSIDSEWSKTYGFEEKKNQNNLKSFQINIFTFQNILHICLLYKTKQFRFRRGPPPLPFTDMSATNSFFYHFPKHCLLGGWSLLVLPFIKQHCLWLLFKLRLARWERWEGLMGFLWQ